VVKVGTIITSLPKSPVTRIVATAVIIFVLLINASSMEVVDPFIESTAQNHQTAVLVESSARQSYASTVCLYLITPSGMLLLWDAFRTGRIGKCLSMIFNFARLFYLNATLRITLHIFPRYSIVILL